MSRFRLKDPNDKKDPKDKAVVKTSVNLPQADLDALRHIAAKRGSTMAEVLRRAISVERFLDQTREEGGKILVETKDKKLRELLIRG